MIKDSKVSLEGIVEPSFTDEFIQVFQNPDGSTTTSSLTASDLANILIDQGIISLDNINSALSGVSAALGVKQTGVLHE